MNVSGPDWALSAVTQEVLNKYFYFFLCPPIGLSQSYPWGSLESLSPTDLYNGLNIALDEFIMVYFVVETLDEMDQRNGGFHKGFIDLDR
jgi:hypothetical protein